MGQEKCPVRLGIIGTNFISDWMAQAAGQTDCCAPAAVYSRRGESGKAFAQKYGIGPVFTDYAEFTRSEAFDAVYVASPNALHYPQALEALQNGKHVLGEKPLALNEKQALALTGLAREKGLTLLEAIRPLYDPFLRVVSENLPRIGRARRATFEFCQYSSRYDRFKAGEHVNIFDASLGNAALMDLGVYCVHCCAALFGEPEGISAASSFLPNGAEASGTALLDYGELQAAIIYSKVTQSVFPSLIQGEEGTISFDTLNQPSRVTLHRRGENAVELPFAPVENNMVHELQVFARCIVGEENPGYYNAQSSMALRIMDEIRRQTGVDFGAPESL